MKSNKNLSMRVFKCLDHDEMVESRICMSKDIDLTNSLLSAIHFAPLDGWANGIQNILFLVYKYLK